MDLMTYALCKGNGGGGSSLPSVTSADNGDTLMVKNGVWTAVKKEGGITNLENTRIQPIPILFNPTPSDEEYYFSTEITPEDISAGYSLPYAHVGDEEVITLNVPPFKASSYAVAYIYTGNTPWYYGIRGTLTADVFESADGTGFRSNIISLDTIGFSGMVGYLVLSPDNLYQGAYRVHLVYWSATIL